MVADGGGSPGEPAAHGCAGLFQLDGSHRELGRGRNWDNGAPTSETSAYFNSGTANVSAGVSGTFVSLHMGTTFLGRGTINISGGHLEGLNTDVSAVIGQEEGADVVVSHDERNLE